MKTTIPWFRHEMPAPGSSFIVDVFAIVCVVCDNCVALASAARFCELHCLRGLHRLRRIYLACNICEAVITAAVNKPRASLTGRTMAERWPTGRSVVR
ncbi:hypothetical protein [Sorangium sp. So ce128]|uniref:hypothetical protein n=1 Tax=Sorangium sp. So ce128 TaxID=3133281 RepID=UPI003F60759A